MSSFPFQRTVTGVRPATGVSDSDFDAGKLIKVDTSRNFGDKDEYPYVLSGTTADETNMWGVLGNRDSNPTGVRDTLIIGGIVAVQIDATFDGATMMDKTILTSTTAGIAKVGDNGKWKVVNGGTLKVRNTATGRQTTINVAYVDLDA